jgi:hypothetical protein
MCIFKRYSHVKQIFSPKFSNQKSRENFLPTNLHFVGDKVLLLFLRWDSFFFQYYIVKKPSKKFRTKKYWKKRTFSFIRIYFKGFLNVEVVALKCWRTFVSKLVKGKRHSHHVKAYFIHGYVARSHQIADSLGTGDVKHLLILKRANLHTHAFKLSCEWYIDSDL